MEGICIKDIVEATGGVLLCGEGEQPLRHISIDSRTMRGDDLFVPLIGEKNDAHRFLTQAMAAGAVCSLTSEHEEAPGGFSGGLIRVKDTKLALQAIGSFLRLRLTIPVVGITGSVGKTTTREMVAAALSAGYQTFKTPGNHNSQVGVPLTVSEITSGDEIAVLELGMSEPGEMEPIARIAAVDVAVMTNIGVTHIENLGSRENILKEKLHIQDGMKAGGVLIVNGDNDLLKTVCAREGCRTIRYGFADYNDYRAEEVTYEEGKPSFVMVHGENRIPMSLSVLGEHNILNALAALAVADCFHVDLNLAAEKLREFGGFKNRQQIYEADGRIIIDDTYNASPDSMKAGLRVLSSFAGSTRRIAVLADMKELGEQTLQFHEEVGEFLAAQPVDLLVTYGELARSIAKGAERGNSSCRMVSFAESEKENMTEFLKQELRSGDAVLFKGSNSMKLFETAAYFTAEGRKL